MGKLKVMFGQVQGRCGGKSGQKNQRRNPFRIGNRVGSSTESGGKSQETEGGLWGTSGLHHCLRTGMNRGHKKKPRRTVSKKSAGDEKLGNQLDPTSARPRTKEGIGKNQ